MARYLRDYLGKPERTQVKAMRHHNHIDKTVLSGLSVFSNDKEAWKTSRLPNYLVPCSGPAGQAQETPESRGTEGPPGYPWYTLLLAKAPYHLQGLRYYPSLRHLALGFSAHRSIL